MCFNTTTPFTNITSQFCSQLRLAANPNTSTWVEIQHASGKCVPRAITSSQYGSPRWTALPRDVQHHANSTCMIPSCTRTRHTPFLPHCAQKTTKHPWPLLGTRYLYTHMSQRRQVSHGDAWIRSRTAHKASRAHWRMAENIKRGLQNTCKVQDCSTYHGEYT